MLERDTRVTIRVISSRPGTTIVSKHPQRDEMRRFLPIVFAIAFTSYGQQVLPADTLGGAGLSEAARRQVLQAIRELAYDTPDSWAEELKLKKIDLGGSSVL